MRIEDAVQDLIDLFERHYEFPPPKPSEPQGSQYCLFKLKVL